MFIISLNYIKAISEIEAHIDAHNDFLNKYYADRKFLMSGRKNPRTGGIIIAQNATIEEIKEIIKEDPFHQYEVAEYEITEFLPTKFNADLKTILQAL
ncbi:YciI family protein [Elizabethkingia anophelis]|uniref:YciI-like protein n=1 Tax=Elizabethkingia anophelis TaxID=1117645 RepID=A0A7Z7PUU2_9FLAO|nr:YciI family protein [Elizabethkingia anophelis]MCT3631310.1 GTP cyclohydrolase [Elizabethkingia anophelis]MCT3634899.1 GTP cyclohydrolase [Elizabethkingia anophelis]MCT3721829.1 GTP cyclohydrolase [Elizabethkingia anophelis]MCT3725348.1 GTP cyclohydrolase [Elizabethkingia anophelis]MCT3778511.1 GTP cyclohydrolase [Elizabethkingia anophelis]